MRYHGRCSPIIGESEPAMGGEGSASKWGLKRSGARLLPCIKLHVCGAMEGEVYSVRDDANLTPRHPPNRRNKTPHNMPYIG